MNNFPELVSPFPFQINPHVDETRRQLNAWVRQVCLVRRKSAYERFERADFAWFVGMVYPTADASRLELMADWFAWLFLVDDQLDDGRVGRDPELADLMLRDLSAVLSGKGDEVVVAPPSAVSSLADLWRRTTSDSSAHWRRRFTCHLEECLRTAATWEVGNRIRGILPDEKEYVEKRRHTGAIYVCMDLIDIVERLDIPESLYSTPNFTAALDAACNVVCWTNDVYSLAKERFLGEVHNLVYLVERHRGLSVEAALRHVRDAIEEETSRYIAYEAELLAAHPEHVSQLRRYTAGMRSWMRGNLDWSSRTQRYQSASAGAANPADYVESKLLGSRSEDAH